jgi:hypothetical protein
MRVRLGNARNPTTLLFDDKASGATSERFRRCSN